MPSSEDFVTYSMHTVLLHSAYGHVVFNYQPELSPG